mmetsp:Transcript_24712/g.58013  ORF Transcript_24712/g.58013 Transcript_24712/m.58013 type:complete len:443 (+) Transcript_24712:256-1584(+)|eukprot:CAMPEP_0197198222 /NCGR_PEP_ID=MMETSP1423-20130617/33260_1 /TAXON_ID=476441 /ORGANISM="Pseudo-nitzschia heimii, Strain UNC1101" /LENGTH=442 /DNA_ID=CAMNT_0042652053 /DNA_START=123 /DNA_END=1451 /DNA_ORIENTATION=-
MNAPNISNDTKPGGNATGTGSAAATGKKAVHVKWAGKTIALGTFPSAEADEKCARAKALTRAWRSTMRPKPTREWVMQELERLGVRVVSGRLGRKAGDEDDNQSSKKSSAVVPPPNMQNKKDSLGMGFGTDLDNLMKQRRNSSLGLSMLNDDMNHRRSSLGSLGPSLGLDGGNGGEPPHRPYVGGGAGAAFEAARDDHYARKREEQRRTSGGLNLGGMGGGPSNMPQMGLSVNPNQHYEMLKLHHMNLLNEIQETTLMMNLYQQQQLQQQQQQLQRQQANDNSGGSGGNDQMSMMMQSQNGGGGGMDGMYNSGGMNQGGSHGMNSMGGNGMGMGNHPHQQQMMQQSGGSTGGNASSTSVGNDGNRNGASSNVQDQLLKSQEEQKALEDQLRKLKDDIAKSKKEAKELKKLAGEKDEGEDGTGSKRKAEEESDSAVKKMKSDD